MIDMVCNAIWFNYSSFFTANPISISREMQAPPYGLTVLVAVVVVVDFCFWLKVETDVSMWHTRFS